ncbi:M48 family metallopeptidase [Patescibacteria group bacterium]
MVKPDQIIKSNRKTISIQVTDEAELIVKVPTNVCAVDISKLLLEHQDWIIKKQNNAKAKLHKLSNLDYDHNKISTYKSLAREIIEKKVDHFSSIIDVDLKKIRLSGAKKRWGSCSSNKTISLNWKLIFVPEEVFDYVVIHELSHIKHMNHSQKFWNEVKNYCPNYKTHKKWLKNNDHLLRLG